MKKSILFLSILLLTSSLNAQWECRSKLGGHLKPIGKLPISWAGEFTPSVGEISQDYFSTLMLFGALDYSKEAFGVYVEGGFKSWFLYDESDKIWFKNKKVGFREAFAQYSKKQTLIRVGLQSAQLADQYLLNERMIGVSLKYSKNAFTYQFTSGTVQKDYARNGIFCSNTYIYDIFPNKGAQNIAKGLGEANFAAISLVYDLSYEKPQEIVSESNELDSFEEFSEVEDTFSEFSEMEDQSKKTLLKMNQLGGILYSEFGNWVPQTFVTTGIFASFILPANIEFSPELLYQHESNNKALLLDLRLSKDYSWSSFHRSFITLDYYRIYELDQNARALNRYSNLMYGEVLRLDAADIPLIACAFKHRFSKHRIHVKMQYAQTLKSTRMREYDVKIGKTFFKALKCTLMGAYIESPLLYEGDNTWLSKLEIRYTF